MIKVATSQAIRFALNKVGLHFQAGNLDDTAYVLGYLDKVNFQSLTGLEIDFYFNEIYLYFDTLTSANQFLAGWKAEEAAKTSQTGSEVKP